MNNLDEEIDSIDNSLEFINNHLRDFNVTIDRKSDTTSMITVQYLDSNRKTYGLCPQNLDEELQLQVILMKEILNTNCIKVKNDLY